jgi:2'-5' RNA ligase
MRLFIGFDLPEALKNQMYEFLRPIQLSEKGWEKAHDYHQTLLFIGEATDDQLADIKLRMNHIIFKPFTLTPAKFRFFNRRIMFLSFEPSEDLLKLKAHIDETFPEWL